MPLLDDLSNGNLCERIGILHGVGLDGETCYYEFSYDYGATKGLFADASTRKAVGSCDSGCHPAIAQYDSGELEVLLQHDGAMECWASRDRGETWAQVTAP